MTQENTTQSEKPNIFLGGGRGTTCLRHMEKGVECGNPQNGVRTKKN